MSNYDLKGNYFNPGIRGYLPKIEGSLSIDENGVIKGDLERAALLTPLMDINGSAAFLDNTIYLILFEKLSKCNFVNNVKRNYYNVIYFLEKHYSGNDFAGEYTGGIINFFTNQIVFEEKKILIEKCKDGLNIQIPVLRGGKIVCEKYWVPRAEEVKITLKRKNLLTG